MKLCFVTDYALSMGGKERQLLEYSIVLRDLGYDLMVLCVSNRGILPTELKRHMIPYQIVSREITSFHKLLILIYQLFKQQKISVAYSFDSLAHLLTVVPAILNRMKLINGSIRDAGVDKGIAYAQSRASLMLSHAVVANSFAGLDYYRVRRHGIVIYNAIDRNRFTQSHFSKFKIVMVANFTSYKNQRCLVDAAIELLERSYPVLVGFVGGGSLLQHTIDYVSLCRFSSSFNFHGFVERTEEIVAQYGIGVLSSTIHFGEGVSNSILEYMGAGLIAVASDIGATKEIITDGINGFLFEGENSHDLAIKLMNIIDNWEAMDIVRERAYGTLDEKFNATKNAKQLINLLSSLG